MPEFETTPAVEPVAIRQRMLDHLSDYYPRSSRNTNLYRLLSALGDILTDIDYEIDYTILDTGVDEARTAALYPNFGYLSDIPIRGDLNWGWDDYRFMLKVLWEAWTIYGTTQFGLRRMGQVATGVSPIFREHYKYAGWYLGQSALGATAIVQTGDYIWNSVSNLQVSTFNFQHIWPQQQTQVWACGDNGLGNGIVYRSWNAGRTWRNAGPPTADVWSGVHGAGPQNTWVCGTVGGNGIVAHWHSELGWDSSVISAGVALNSIWMRSVHDGWVVGNIGRVYRWSSGIWTLTAMPGPVASLFAVHGTPDGYVYAAGANSKVVRYDPGTDTWSDVSVPGPARDFRSVCVVDANTAFLCGLNGVVNWTTDGGTSWSGTILPPALSLYGIWASSDSQTIRVVGVNGALHYSSDGGTTWTTEFYQGSGVNLNGIYMRPNDNMGYICGDSGVLLRRTGQSPGFTLPDGTFVANDELIDGAILESRYGRRNSVDVIVWNVMDYTLLWHLLNKMKPAHVKLFIMFEWPFVMDYYYYDYDFYTGSTSKHFLEDVGSGRGTVVNGREYGESMSKVVGNEEELYIPQLP